MAKLRTVEIGGLEYYACPTCSKRYAAFERPPTWVDGRQTDTGERAEIPGACKRCKGPMDYDKAIAYGEKLAEAEHQPNLRAIGERMRSLAGVSA